MEMKVIKELVMAIIIIGIPIAIVIYLLFYNDKLSDKKKKEIIITVISFTIDMILAYIDMELVNSVKIERFK